MTLKTFRHKVADKADNIHPLTKGDPIPDGELKDSRGRTVHLRSQVRKKSAVLVFYRGGWSSSCVAHLDQLSRIEPELFKYGFQVLAVSPEEPGRLRETLAKYPLPFTFLGDGSMEVIRKFGLAFKAGAQDYREYLQGRTGGEVASRKGRLLMAAPADYVVDVNGLIHFAYYNPHPNIRIDPQELLKVVLETVSD